MTASRVCSLLQQQQQQNANLPLNALGSMGTQLPCGPASQPPLRSTPPPPPPASSSTAAPNLQQHQLPNPPQAPPSAPPGPAPGMATPPGRTPSRPHTPLQPPPDPALQLTQPTSVQPPAPSTPVSFLSAPPPLPKPHSSTVMGVLVAEVGSEGKI